MTTLQKTEIYCDKISENTQNVVLDFCQIVVCVLKILMSCNKPVHVKSVSTYMLTYLDASGGLGLGLGSGPSHNVKHVRLIGNVNGFLQYCCLADH